MSILQSALYSAGTVGICFFIVSMTFSLVPAWGIAAEIAVGAGAVFIAIAAVLACILTLQSIFTKPKGRAGE